MGVHIIMPTFSLRISQHRRPHTALKLGNKIVERCIEVRIPSLGGILELYMSWAAVRIGANINLC